MFAVDDDGCVLQVEVEVVGGGSKGVHDRILRHHNVTAVLVQQLTLLINYLFFRGIWMLARNGAPVCNRISVVIVYLVVLIIVVVFND